MKNNFHAKVFIGLGFFVTAMIVLWCLAYLFYGKAPTYKVPVADANLASFLSGAASLVAIIWLVIAVWIQKRSLEETTRLANDANKISLAANKMASISIEVATTSSQQSIRQNLISNVIPDAKRNSDFFTESLKNICIHSYKALKIKDAVTELAQSLVLEEHDFVEKIFCQVDSLEITNFSYDFDSEHLIFDAAQEIRVKIYFYKNADKAILEKNEFCIEFNSRVKMMPPSLVYPSVLLSEVVWRDVEPKICHSEVINFAAEITNYELSRLKFRHSMLEQQHSDGNQFTDFLSKYYKIFDFRTYQQEIDYFIKLVYNSINFKREGESGYKDNSDYENEIEVDVMWDVPEEAYDSETFAINKYKQVYQIKINSDEYFLKPNAFSDLYESGLVSKEWVRLETDVE